MKHEKPLPAVTAFGPIAREITVSDAKARLAELLDDVERGETVTITRHGKPVARIVPEPEARKREVTRALATLKEIGKRAKARGLTKEELLAARHEGHKY